MLRFEGIGKLCCLRTHAILFAGFVLGVRSRVVGTPADLVTSKGRRGPCMPRDPKEIKLSLLPPQNWGRSSTFSLRPTPSSFIDRKTYNSRRVVHTAPLRPENTMQVLTLMALEIRSFVSSNGCGALGIRIRQGLSTVR
jgi:hypothetical protein